MMNITYNSLLHTANFLVINQSVTANIYREQAVRLDTSFNDNDRVNVNYALPTTTTYNSSLAPEPVVDGGYDLLKKMVLTTFKEQGVNPPIVPGFTKTDIPDIGNDGYLGVEKTAERIFSFAVGIAGGDPARIDGIRQGVKNGFQQALDDFGGWLPEISYETFDTVLIKLEDWGGALQSPETHN